MSDMETTPAGGLGLLTQEQTQTDTPWVTVLFNDPVNLVGHVVRALTTSLPCDEETAKRHMITAHTTGRAAVFSGTRQEAEKVAAKLAAASLTTTTEKSGS